MNFSLLNFISMISLLKDYLVVLGGSLRGGEETWIPSTNM